MANVRWSLLFLLLAAPTQQRFPTSTLTGTWESLQWNLDIWALDLKVSGTILTGTVSINNLRPMEIYDGKLETNRIEFKVKSPDGMRVIAFSGTPGTGGLKLTRKVEILQAGGNPGGNDIFGVSGPASFVAKRVSESSSRRRNNIDK